MLLTYAYSYMFIILAGPQFNALIFSAAILKISTAPNSPSEHRLQKFIAISLVSAVCVLQSYSRMNYVRFSNMFALYKILLLTSITIIGWLALANVRSQAAGMEATTGYGINNFHRSFEDINSQPYAVALAMLIIMRAYGGYESANFVLEEVRRPTGDENRVFKRSALMASAMTTFFYVSVNIALVSLARV
jgi:amino acid transporter